MFIQGEVWWANQRRVNPALNQAITAVEQWTMSVGRQNVPDQILLNLAFQQELALRVQPRLSNPQGYLNLVHSGANLNGDNIVGGADDACIAWQMNY